MPSQPSHSGSRLKARPVPATTFNAAMFASTSSPTSPPAPAQSSFAPMKPRPTTQSSFAPLQPTPSTFAPLQPSPRPSTQAHMPASSSGPNYNISLTPSAPSPRPQQSPMSFMAPAPAPARATPSPSIPLQSTQGRPPPGYTSGLMQPTVAPKPSIPTVNGKQDWGDFDPLK